MSKPRKIEFLISENGEEMHVIAHNFNGRGCEEVAAALRLGNVVECSPTADYYQSDDQSSLEKQGH
jgi:hypothetical protein